MRGVMQRAGRGRGTPRALCLVNAPPVFPCRFSLGMRHVHLARSTWQTDGLVRDHYPRIATSWTPRSTRRERSSASSSLPPIPAPANASGRPAGTRVGQPVPPRVPKPARYTPLAAHPRPDPNAWHSAERRRARESEASTESEARTRGHVPRATAHGPTSPGSRATVAMNAATSVGVHAPI